MNFARPLMFLGLPLIVLPLILFLWWAWRERQRLITQFISARLVALLKVGVSPVRQKLRLALIVLSVSFMILALTRPQWGSSAEEVRQRGLDIIVAIDASKSMLAEDVQPNRLTRAKLEAINLMQKARTDRLGLVAFASSAFLMCPLTLDETAFAQSVNALDTRTFSQGGTAIGEAIDEARKTFKTESDNHKVLIIFTDGEDHDSQAVESAKAAAKEGIIIDTIGIGSVDGEQIRYKDDHGRLVNLMDEDGKPVVSKLDEEFLKKLSSLTPGGTYLPLRGAKTVEQLYDAVIAPLPKSEGTTHIFRRLKERYHWFLGVAIALLILEMFFPDRKRKKSTSSTSSDSQAVSMAALVTLSLFLMPASVMAGPGKALKEYNSGDYENAFKHYQELLDKKSNDPRLHFNSGDAAYQAGQLDKAQSEFSEALNSPDIQLQQKSYYNLANTYYRLGQQSQEPDKKQEFWENSLKNYESALKLNKQDPQAAFNNDFVKRQLEELKKQQPQQNSQDDKGKKQSKEKDKDQKKQDQNNKKDQTKQDEKDQQDQQQNQEKQQQQDQNSQQKKQDQKSQSDQEKQQQADQKSPEQKKKEQDRKAAEKKKAQEEQKAAAAAADQKEEPPSPEDAKKEAAMMAAGQMTPTQAKQLLDTHKNDDKVFHFSPTNFTTMESMRHKTW